MPRPHGSEIAALAVDFIYRQKTREDSRRCDVRAVKEKDLKSFAETRAGSNPARSECTLHVICPF